MCFLDFLTLRHCLVGSPEHEPILRRQVSSKSVKFQGKIFFFFFLKMLAVLDLHCCKSFSVVESAGYFLALVCRLLIAVASLAVEHGIQWWWLPSSIAQGR